MLREILRYKQRLDNLFSKISAFSGRPAEFELRSHWTRYLCVLVSGFLEVSIYEIYTAYAKDKSAPNIANYIEAQLEGFQNPKMGKILQVVEAFNPKWAEEIQNLPDYLKIKNAVDSVVANRHKIAHGEDVDIEYNRLRSWYADVYKLIVILYDQCGLT